MQTDDGVRHEIELRDRIKALTAERDDLALRALTLDEALTSAVQMKRATFERCAKIAEAFGEPYALQSNTGAMMFRAVTDKIAAAIRDAAALQ